mmetsp:Transcript_2732/g.3890  ORF Transcript_2732/g.3890 Transcript_2732/m.3890 type:complete len:297 (-) Transcript_2732:158-1048(-)
MPKSKWYAVAKGRAPGIYQTWDECKAQTAGFSGAIFKSFKTRDDAQAFIISNTTSATTTAAPSLNNTAGKKRGRDVTDVTTHTSQKKRSNYHPFKNKAAEFCIDIHFDGGSRGNPGVAGSGAEVIVVNNTARHPITTKYLIREFCGNKETNNYAEYNGLIAGLKQAKKVINETFGEILIPSLAPLLNVTKPITKLQVYGDSNLVIQQLKGNWKCKNESLKPLYHQCQRLIAEIKNNIASDSEVSFDHVYREQNKVADELANEAMDQRRSWMTSDADADKVVTAQMGMGICTVQYNT